MVPYNCNIRYDPSGRPLGRPPALLLFALLVLPLGQAGCLAPGDYRRQADQASERIIAEKQLEALGRHEPFAVERPSDILRRRLLVEQKLPYAGEASLGTDRLRPVAHWPEKDYPRPLPSGQDQRSIDPNGPVRLGLLDVLQIGARNSFTYQSRKEEVFRTALQLDLERDAFRNTFAGQVENLLSTDSSQDRTTSGMVQSAAAGATRRWHSGAQFSSALAVDLANLLTLGGASSLGLAADASIAVPLLRGAGEHIAAEPLTQAERDMVYALYEFERFKRTFAVDVAREYLSVLRQMDEVKNAEENYRSLIASSRRSRRLANAGRLPEIQVDQAVQNELRARNRWISAQEQFENRLDEFKTTLGLPPDSRIELDRQDLEQLRLSAGQLAAGVREGMDAQTQEPAPPADAPIILNPPSSEDAGPLELAEPVAVRLALANRLDLRVAIESVIDAQRQAVVAADALGAELTFLGAAGYGERRDIGSAGSRDARLRYDRGRYDALITLDLPLERTAERNAYRDSLLNLDGAVREVQILEDAIKLAIRDELRILLESRESLKIQTQSVLVAQKRVRSSNLFLEAGRAQIRDLLEAQEALLSAQNALTSAVINYRIAQLELQRDMGLLTVEERGLWQEFTPERLDDDPNQS
ncbi:MAG: TolC family protein [Sedimentisphaerales bacterium]|nr:TolC family protein [Sedimentisphaerales bacterium]